MCFGLQLSVSPTLSQLQQEAQWSYGDAWVGFPFPWISLGTTLAFHLTIWAGREQGRTVAKIAKFFHQGTIPQTETSLGGLGLALECQPEALFLVSLRLSELLWPQTKPNAHVE